MCWTHSKPTEQQQQAINEAYHGWVLTAHHEFAQLYRSWKLPGLMPTQQQMPFHQAIRTNRVVKPKISTAWEHAQATWEYTVANWVHPQQAGYQKPNPMSNNKLLRIFQAAMDSKQEAAAVAHLLATMACAVRRAHAKSGWVLATPAKQVGQHLIQQRLKDAQADDIVKERQDRNRRRIQAFEKGWASAHKLTKPPEPVAAPPAKDQDDEANLYTELTTMREE